MKNEIPAGLLVRDQYPLAVMSPSSQPDVPTNPVEVDAASATLVESFDQLA